MGAIFLPTWAPEALLPLAHAADEAGVDGMWVWEDCFKQSGVAAASACLAATVRIAMGIGLMPAPLRNVAAPAWRAVAPTAGELVWFPTASKLTPAADPLMVVSSSVAL